VSYSTWRQPSQTGGGCAKFATIDLLLFTVMVSGFAVPLASPLQPVKSKPVAGTAVKRHRGARTVAVLQRIHIDVATGARKARAESETAEVDAANDHTSSNGPK